MPVNIYPLRAAIRHALFSGESHVTIHRDELSGILKEYERMGRRYNNMFRDWIEIKGHEHRAAKKRKKAKGRALPTTPAQDKP